MSKRYESSNLPKNVSINVISGKIEKKDKEASFLQITDDFDENDDNNLVQKNNSENELTREDSFDSNTIINNLNTQENNFDENALRNEIKQEIGTEIVSYEFDK